MVGSNCLDERSAIAGLGPITVDPSIQNRGVGRKLMEAVIVRARGAQRSLGSGCSNRRFITDPWPCIADLGFDAREPLSVMQGPPLRKQIEECSVRSARVSDVEECRRGSGCQSGQHAEEDRTYLKLSQPTRKMKIIESVGAIITVASHLYRSGHWPDGAISAASHISKSFATTIRPDIGENEAYKEALRRGEIGLQRPLGVNVAGVDFITAIRRGKSDIEALVCTDVKTSQVGRFPTAKKTLPGNWRAEVDGAVARLGLKVNATDFTGVPLHSFPIPETIAEIKLLEDAIVLALKNNNVRLRQ